MQVHADKAFDYFKVSLLPGIGSVRGRGLLREFGSFAALLRARESDLRRIDGFNKLLAVKIREALQKERRSGDITRIAEVNAALAEKHGFSFLPICDNQYPEILRSIYDPPLFLFCRGEYAEQNTTSIAVVGTRNPSDYGRRATEEFCRSFVEHGVTVVSGLALGIDTVAHRCTLRFGGRTIAVLGSGLLRIYPGINRDLAERISENGCVLSELPLNAKPDATNFPRRNRIISGLSRGLVVMESAASGGAMISATIALDQNRDVYAVPGSIHNLMSSGPHRLLRQSMAQLVTSAEDIIGEMNLGKQPDAPVSSVQLSLLEQEIADMLNNEPVHVDEIAAVTNRPHATLLADLLGMEFKGLIHQLPGKYFILETLHRK